MRALIGAAVPICAHIHNFQRLQGFYACSLTVVQLFQVLPMYCPPGSALQKLRQMNPVGTHCIFQRLQCLATENLHWKNLE